MSSFDWELDKLTTKKKINALMKLKGNSPNILQMVLEETKGGKERRENASKEKNDSLHVKCA